MRQLVRAVRPLVRGAVPLSVLALLLAVTRVAAAEPRYTVRTAEVAPARLLAWGERGLLLLYTLREKEEIPPPPHAQVEILYFLEGKATLGSAKLTRGDAVYARPGGRAEPVRAKGKATVLALYAVAAEPAAGGASGASGTSGTSGTGGTGDAGAARIRRSTEATPLVIGGGKGQVTILFDRETAGDGSAYVGRLVTAAGMTVPEHVHGKEAELLYVVRGKGEMTVEGRKVLVEAGMAVHIPPNIRHSFVATSEAGLEAVQFYAPSGPEQRFKAAR